MIKSQQSVESCSPWKWENISEDNEEDRRYGAGLLQKNSVRAQSAEPYARVSDAGPTAFPILPTVALRLRTPHPPS
jgi:hypothetical protein